MYPTLNKAAPTEPVNMAANKLTMKCFSIYLKLMNYLNKDTKNVFI